VHRHAEAAGDVLIDMGMRIDEAGNTNLPVTSITSRALVGRMSGCTAAILPLRMATSLMPSMPEAGQITRPPRRSWSKLALIDIAISSVFRRRIHPRSCRDTKHTSYFTKAKLMP
jgi:hypothetical protein